MTVEVYPLRLQDAPGEIWYGVKWNGRDLQAGWADPDAARRAGERYEREANARRRGGTKMETTETERPQTPDEPDPTLPEEPETPETPAKEDDDEED